MNRKGLMPEQPVPQATTEAPVRRLHFGPRFWIVALLVLLFSIVGFVTSGLGGLLIMVAFAAFLTGLHSLVAGRQSWASLAGRKTGAVLLGGSLVAMMVGGAIPPPSSPQAPEAATGSASTSASTSTSTSRISAPPATAKDSFTAESASDPKTVIEPTEPASVAIPDSSTTTQTTAIALLATLPVKGRAPMTGYLRTAMFGAAWLDEDRNGCDTRNDMLSRDLTGVVKAGSCRVLSGHLVSPYSGGVIDFVRGELTSTTVQIDHVVSLGDAWRTGAQQLSAAQRVALANDPINLFAVDARSNAQKRAGDAATWLPASKPFRCTYVSHQVSVKATYGLWVTQAEHDAMARVLSNCAQMLAVTSPFAPTPAPQPVVVGTAPPVTAPVTAPAKPAPAKSAPAKSAPGKEARVKETPVKPAPVKATRVPARTAASCDPTIPASACR